MVNIDVINQQIKGWKKKKKLDSGISADAVGYDGLSHS